MEREVTKGEFKELFFNVDMYFTRHRFRACLGCEDRDIHCHQRRNSRYVCVANGGQWSLYRLSSK